MIGQHFQKCITLPSQEEINAKFFGGDDLYEIMQSPGTAAVTK